MNVVSKDEAEVEYIRRSAAKLLDEAGMNARVLRTRVLGAVRRGGWRHVCDAASVTRNAERADEYLSAGGYVGLEVPEEVASFRRQVAALRSLVAVLVSDREAWEAERGSLVLVLGRLATACMLAAERALRDAGAL